jgi:hypothetical protein
MLRRQPSRFMHNLGLDRRHDPSDRGMLMRPVGADQHPRAGAGRAGYAREVGDTQPPLRGRPRTLVIRLRLGQVQKLE